MLPGFAKRPRRTLTRSPRAVPWESALPWALVRIIHSAAAVPARDDRGRGSACAKAVDGSTSRGLGTSVTAKIPKACAGSGAGKRRGGQPDGVSRMRSKPRTPRPNRRAASASPLRTNYPIRPQLRRRVVTQQEFFRRCPCATGQGAMNHRCSRAAARRVTAVPPVVRRFAGCSIGNASGSCAALSRAAVHARRSPRPPGRGLVQRNTTQPGQHHDRRHPGDPSYRLRRSAVAGRALQAP